jgi:hypothetical protein
MTQNQKVQTTVVSLNNRCELCGSRELCDVCRREVYRRINAAKVSTFGERVERYLVHVAQGTAKQVAVEWNRLAQEERMPS